MCQINRIKRGGKRTCSRKCGVNLAIKERRWHLPKNKVGEANHNWRGGRHQTTQGYIRVLAPKDHPFRGKNRYLLEHRLVMEKHLGRYLKPHEKVHHRNGVKNDNRIENLELVSLAFPYGEVECPHCQERFLVH
jgi:hypothetical protein